jgi:DNA modification methylase
MNRARVTVETTSAQKKALDNALTQCGLSLPEWFEGQIQEMTASLGIGTPNLPSEIESLTELARPEEVFSKLESVDWSFTDADTGYLSHDIHPYPAKFIPQLPRTLISCLSLRGELVYDPFGGSGTTALEAVLLGRRALSSDIHPLSRVIGEAKTVTLTCEEDAAAVSLAEQLWILSAQPANLSVEIDRVRHLLEQKFIPPIPNMADWFHENATIELAYLRWRIDALQTKNLQALAKVAFSKSILKASFQDEETRYARRPREVTKGAVIKLFVVNFQAGLKKVRALGSLLRFRRPDFQIIDLRNAPVRESPFGFSLQPNSVDLIVTSPPYPNSNDYHLYHRFRLFWLGFDPRELAAKEIGSHLRYQKEDTGFDSYLSEMTACLRTLHAVLRPGRFAVLVLGDGIFQAKLYPTAHCVGQAARTLRFEIVGIIPRNVHQTKRSFISAARRLRSEHLLVLRKPSETASIDFLEPPYKLWPYERSLRRMELHCLLPSARLSGTEKIRTTVDALSLDKLRRLTFTHDIAGTSIGRERTWQAVLENGDVAVASRRKDPKYVTHGIHPYKGKFYPQLAKALFNLAGLKPSETVLDPFCGSGTVLLEAYLNGLNPIGADLNILATKIARVKTQLLEVDAYVRDQLLARFQELLSQPDESKKDLESFSNAAREELESWFPIPVLRKLGWLFRKIEEVPEARVREGLEILVSSIVRQISQQEPRDLRIRRREVPLKDAPVYELVAPRVADLRRRLQHFSERSIFAPVRFLSAKVIHGDSRELQALTESGVERDSVDAIVTSPPYATALPYIDTERLSILLLFAMASKDRSLLESSLIGTREINKQYRNALDGRIDNAEFDEILSSTAIQIISEVRRRNRASNAGFRKQNTAALLYLYFRDMSKVMTNLTAVLKNGGNAFFVIGDNKTVAGEKAIPIRTGQALREIGSAIGLKLIDDIPITVTTENRCHVKNSITENAILWFKKSGGVIANPSDVLVLATKSTDTLLLGRS